MEVWGALVAMDPVTSSQVKDSFAEHRVEEVYQS